MRQDLWSLTWNTGTSQRNVRHQHADSWAIGEKKQWGINGEWGGLCRGCPQEHIRHIPIHIIPSICVEYVEFCACSMLCQNNVRCSQMYRRQHYRNLLHSTIWKQQFLCVFTQAKETGERFWQNLLPYSPSLILPFLSPPIICLHIR